MAVFNSYLLGNAKKSVGNVTLVYMQDKNIARAKIFNRKDNATPEVLAQRERVRVLGAFGRKMLPVIRKGFVGIGKGSAWNAFMAGNMAAVTVGDDGVGTLDYGTLRLASGVLVAPDVTVEYDEENRNYFFTQGEQEEEEGFAASDDRVYGVLLETVLQRVRLVSLGERGTADGSGGVALPEAWDNANVKVYAFATSRNGKMASDSIHLTV